MSILSVDQISPIGSGTTITLNATEVKTGTEITVGTGASIFSPAGNTLTFGTNNVERIRIKNDGKVGIGTNNPSNALDVQGGTTNTAIVARSTDAKAQVSLVDNATTSVGSVCIGAEGDALFLTSGSGGTERLRIASNGDFGFNDTSPTANASGNDTVLSIKGKGSSYSGKIDFKDSSGNIDNHIASDNTIFSFNCDPNSQNGNTAMLFSVHGSERFRFGRHGQLGIAGANYGSAGQVLTSQGGSSAVQWASPSGRTQGSYTQASSLGSGTYTFTGIPSTAYKVVLNVYEISSASQSYMYMRVGSSGGIVSSGYKNLAGYHYYNVTDSTRSSSDARFSLFAHNWDNASYKWTGQQTLTRIYKSGTQEQWMCNTDIIETTTTNWQNLLWEQRGIVNLGSNTLDRIVLYTSAGNFDGGYLSVDYFT